MGFDPLGFSPAPVDRLLSGVGPAGLTQVEQDLVDGLEPPRRVAWELWFLRQRFRAVRAAVESTRDHSTGAVTGGMLETTISPNEIIAEFSRLLRFGPVTALSRVHLTECAARDGIRGELLRWGYDPDAEGIRVAYVSPMSDPVAALVTVPKTARRDPDPE